MCAHVHGHMHICGEIRDNSQESAPPPHYVDLGIELRLLSLVAITVTRELCRWLAKVNI